MSLVLGQAAPDAELYRTDGSKVALHTFWDKQPIVLTFLRHFGCAFCREYMSKLRSAYSTFVERGVEVVAIAQGTPAQAAHFSYVFRIPFPMLVDPARQSYAAYAVGEGTLLQTLNPAVATHMVSTALHGYLPSIGGHFQAVAGRDGLSVKQLGGTFVIGQGGALCYMHIASPVYRSPSIEELLAVCDS